MTRADRASAETEETALTPAQVKALRFLDDKMWSSAMQIGIAVGATPAGGANYSAIGAGIAGALRRKGFVSPLEMGLWRISAAGRAALYKATGRGYD